MLSAKQKEILEAAGGKYWEKMDRYYFEAADLIDVTQYSKNYGQGAHRYEPPERREKCIVLS